MSYSRWSNSNWYTFANCNGNFTAWYAKRDKDWRDWSNEELADIPACLTWYRARDYSDADVNEIEGYMRTYIAEENDSEHWSKLIANASDTGEGE